MTCTMSNMRKLIMIASLHYMHMCIFSDMQSLKTYWLVMCIDKHVQYQRGLSPLKYWWLIKKGILIDGLINTDGVSISLCPLFIQKTAYQNRRSLFWIHVWLTEVISPLTTFFSSVHIERLAKENSYSCMKEKHTARKHAKKPELHEEKP